MLLKIASTVVLVLVVVKFVVVPQLQSVARSAARPWLGYLGVALIGVVFAGIATMPIIANYRHIDTVLTVLASLGIVAAALVLFAGWRSKSE